MNKAKEIAVRIVYKYMQTAYPARKEDVGQIIHLNNSKVLALIRVEEMLIVLGERNWFGEVVKEEINKLKIKNGTII